VVVVVSSSRWWWWWWYSEIHGTNTMIVTDVYKILTGKPEEMGPIQRPKPRYGDTIKT